MTSPTRWLPALAVLAICSAGTPALAQLEANLGGLAEDNVRGYLQPLPTGLSATMNAAVFRSGNVPISGLNIWVGLQAMSAELSDDDRLFTPTDPAGFTSTEQRRVPTVIGDPEAVAVQGTAGSVLYYPGGFDLEYFAMAAPQVTVGSVMGTRAVLRYISIDIGDADLGELKLVGIGAQHSISQYMPDLPLDLAAGIFYQTFEIGDIVDATALYIGATGSRSYGVLEPYAGLGLDTFDMDVSYTYDLAESEETIVVDFDRETNLHLTLGVGLNLPVAKLHLEYNVAAANGVALGLSFGI